jgi:hypothetical protein
VGIDSPAPPFRKTRPRIPDRLTKERVVNIRTSTLAMLVIGSMM